MQSANYFVQNWGPYGAWQVKYNYTMLIYDDYTFGLSGLYCTNSVCLLRPIYFGCTVHAGSQYITVISAGVHFQGVVWKEVLLVLSNCSSRPETVFNREILMCGN